MQNKKIGNLLGSAQAEADRQMLSQGFIETADYQALLHTTDFSYVVGRRGTGKSAIYQRLKDVLSSDTGTILITEEPQDYEMLEMQSLLASISKEYRLLRPISRLLWTVHFLLRSTSAVSTHYLFNKSENAVFLNEYIKRHQDYCTGSGITNCMAILKRTLSGSPSKEEIARIIATNYQVRQVTDSLHEALEKTELRIVALYDRLDEAWVPDVPSVSILGGLARTASEYRERRFPFYPILFIRDNMIRALAQLDDDFTRHIEGHTLRLQWNEESLFHFIAARLRIVLKLDSVENEVKVWNRFAQRELQNREGFNKCLRFTLFRPRDILVLLNESYVNATREGRNVLIENDIEKSAISISQYRLEDLCKEYDKVLPGLRLFVTSFHGLPALQPFRAVSDHLQYIADHNDYADSAARDLILFETGSEMFSALYSVGFIGLKDASSGNYLFCHDGAMSELLTADPNRETLIHPCYWKALDISVTSEPSEMLIKVNDEYTAPPKSDTFNLRLKRLGRLPEELSGIPTGHDGSSAFETWVARAVRLLFAGSLTNIELKPNPTAALNQRDVVATNITKTTFWQRIYEDYRSRQIVFECKNYEELTPDDFRQILDYTSGEYGSFAIAVRRGKSEALTDNEKDRTKALFFEHKRLLMIVPAPIFALCIRKLRTPKKYDYTDFTMSNHMDVIVRSHLSLTHSPRYRQKRKK